MSDGFLALDPACRLTHLNRAGEELLGRGRREVVGQNALRAFPQVKGTVFARHIGRALREGASLDFEAYLDAAPLRNWYRVLAAVARGRPPAAGPES
jgi:PAS domain-containing protein